HGDADRTHREARPMALAGDVLPQPEVLGAEAVDAAIGQLDVDLSADHRHPASPWCGMKVRKFGRLIQLEGASCTGLQRLQYRVVLLEFFHPASAIRPRIHAKDTHRLASVSSLVTIVVTALCPAAASLRGALLPPRRGPHLSGLGGQAMLWAAGGCAMWCSARKRAPPSA